MAQFAVGWSLDKSLLNLAFENWFILAQLLVKLMESTLHTVLIIDSDRPNRSGSAELEGSVKFGGSAEPRSEPNTNRTKSL